jgi:hypothetical protein
MKTLAKELPALTVSKVALEFTIEAGNYRQPLPGIPQYVASTYFDLAGMSQREKTMFFEGAAMQEIIPPSTTGATAGDFCGIVDLMTTTPLTDTQVIAYSTQGNLAGSQAQITFDETIYGRVRIYNIDIDNAAGGYFILLGDNQTGSLNATASDRIYVYRAVFFSPTNGDGVMGTSGARYLLRTEPKEEEEYRYLMRLRRSYELQQEPDVD